MHKMNVGLTIIKYDMGKKGIKCKKKKNHGASDRTLSDGNNLTAAYMYVCLKHCTKKYE